LYIYTNEIATIMGMYTELNIGCSLKNDTPKILIESLDYLFNGEEKQPRPEKESEFDRDYLNYIERTHSIEEIQNFIDEHKLNYLFFSSSYYFGAHETVHKFTYDHTSDDYVLISRSNLKDRKAIDDFIKYIGPYVEDGSGGAEIFATVQYELDEFPTLYGVGGGVYYVEDEETKKRFRDEVNKRWETLEELFTTLVPEFKVTEEVLKKHNVPKEKWDDVTYIQTWEYMVEYIIEKYKHNKPDMHLVTPRDYEIEDGVKEVYNKSQISDNDVENFKKGVKWAIDYMKEYNDINYTDTEENNG